VALNGSVALASQVSWIQNASVKDNILFGHALDEDWYKRVMFACALESDIASLPQGSFFSVKQWVRIYVADKNNIL